MDAPCITLAEAESPDAQHTSTPQPHGPPPAERNCPIAIGDATFITLSTTAQSYYSPSYHSKLLHTTLRQPQITCNDRLRCPQRRGSPSLTKPQTLESVAGRAQYPIKVSGELIHSSWCIPELLNFPAALCISISGVHSDCSSMKGPCLRGLVMQVKKDFEKAKKKEKILFMDLSPNIQCPTRKKEHY